MGQPGVTLGCNVQVWGKCESWGAGGVGQQVAALCSAPYSVNGEHGEAPRVIHVLIVRAALMPCPHTSPHLCPQ